MFKFFFRCIFKSEETRALMVIIKKANKKVNNNFNLKVMIRKVNDSHHDYKKVMKKMNKRKRKCNK